MRYQQVRRGTNQHGGHGPGHWEGNPAAGCGISRFIAPIDEGTIFKRQQARYTGLPEKLLPQGALVARIPGLLMLLAGSYLPVP